MVIASTTPTVGDGNGNSACISTLGLVLLTVPFFPWPFAIPETSDVFPSNPGAILTSE